MEYFTEKLINDEYFENRISTICSFNNAKCIFNDGKIIKIKETNVSIIEPHQVMVKWKQYKILLLYFDKDNMFLYDRTMPITLNELDKLLKEIRSMGGLNV